MVLNIQTFKEHSLFHLFQRSLLHSSIMDKPYGNLSSMVESTAKFIHRNDMLKPQVGMPRGRYNFFISTIS